MAKSPSKTSGILIDREEQRRALGRVYRLLLRLAAQREACDEWRACEANKPTVTGDASVSQPDGPVA